MRGREKPWFLAAVLLAGWTVADAAEHRGGAAMDAMLEAIEADARRTAYVTDVRKIDPQVMAAIGRVPREAYVPEGSAPYAYLNSPLSIGHGQTISQPFIVALMTHLMAVEPTDRVLEIGTGSGYQAAVLGELVDQVYTIEIIPELADRAAETLRSQGFDNIHVRAGDGWYGWPAHAPFDAIIVTAVAEEVPPKLVEQLAEGGRLVLPVGPQHGAHDLIVVTRGEDGELDRRSVLPVRFVPLTGDH